MCFTERFKMNGVFTIGRFLTRATGRAVTFLTLILTFLHTQNCLADDDMAYVAPPLVAGAPMDSPLDEMNKGHRLGLLLNYVRHEAPGWAPGLREDLRAPLDWMMSGTRPFRDAFDEDGSPETGNGFLGSVFGPLSGLMQPPSSEAGQAMWLSPGYHHMGFLPFHDAMMMGVNLRQHLFDNRVHLDLHPFYGQNWVSLNGYGGAEMGIGLAHGDTGQVWGRIALRYTDGASNLMDNGRGFDMSAQLRLSDHLNLTAGVNSDQNTDLGNYVLLRWKLVQFGH
jgi:hypothetical protein